MRKERIDEITQDPAVNIALDTIKRKKSAIIFAPTKRGAEKTAEDVAKKIKFPNPEWEELSVNVLKAIAQPTKQCKRLSECLKKGTAFHHAGLTAKQREIVEDAFRNRLISIICSTTTLGAGLDLPASRAVMKSLKRYGMHGLQYIPVLEYHQMTGRAGRPRYDRSGEAITIVSTKGEKERVKKDFINGPPEDIYSKLAVEPVLRFYVLSLIASGFVNTKKDILEFFGRTFWAFQYRDMAMLEGIITRMLGLLEEWEFIKSPQKGDFVSADEMGKDEYTATLLGKRVAELYIDPLSARRIADALKSAAPKGIVPLALLQVICHNVEMKPLLRVSTREWEDMQEKLAEHCDSLLEKEPAMYEPEHEDFMASFKTALMLHEWMEEKEEEYLLEKYNIRPGETRAKITNADWMLYSAYEITRITGFKGLLKDISRTRIRLKYGVKEELLPLLRLKDVGRVRARALYRNRIRDVGDVKKAEYANLSAIIGAGIARKLKEQVGEKVKEEIPVRKRKGQMSLKKF